MDTQTVTCPECQQGDVKLTPTGKLWKHPGADGETCPGTGQVFEPADAEVPVDLADDWGDEPDEEADTSGGEQPDEDGELDGNPDPSPPTKETDGGGPDGPEDQGPVYEWVLPIQQPALYLNDAAWHYANARAAAAAAAASGYVVAGEAKCTSTAANEDGTGLDLTYTLPVEARRG